LGRGPQQCDARGEQPAVAGGAGFDRDFVTGDIETRIGREQDQARHDELAGCGRVDGAFEAKGDLAAQREDLGGFLPAAGG
jgi:hypothetical protein